MEVFRFTLFALAALTSIGCMCLLFRAYFRSSLRLLFWVALCFVFLSINNVVLFVDTFVLPQVDLRVVRLAAALAGIACLIYAFIWESE
jgi:hydrogenase/urease accessory protein HupE